MAPTSPATSEPLRSSDLQAALDFVSDLTETIDDAEAFARCGVEQLPRLAASELTTLSLCDLCGWLVSFELNRRGSDFSEREVALLEQVRPAVSRLFRRAGLPERTHRAWLCDASAATDPPGAASLRLTARERDVLRWVAAGKTDRDVADILAISSRTVHKHLEHVYAKLGVETRTAAVMRALAPGPMPGAISPSPRSTLHSLG